MTPLDKNKVQRPVIGVVGGMGPQAGLDLLKKILANTLAKNDQDHIETVLISRTSIPDRTQFLIGASNENPAPVVFQVIKQLVEWGVTSIGIPCNSVHSSPVFRMVMELCRQNNIETPILHLVKETGRYINEEFSDHKRVLVLCTSGSVEADLFSPNLSGFGIQVQYPEKTIQNDVHRLIYSIKSDTEFSGTDFESFINKLKNAYCPNVNGIVLGCTELSIIADRFKKLDFPIYDSNDILARALIRESSPSKLKYL